MQRVTIPSTCYHTLYQTFSLSLAWFGTKATFYHMFERVTTLPNFVQTWIGHDATRYRNFNVLRDALPYIFSKFSMVWDYLQRVTTRYRKMYEKIHILKKIIMVTCGNALQIAQNRANLRENIQYRVG